MEVSPGGEHGESPVGGAGGEHAVDEAGGEAVAAASGAENDCGYRTRGRAALATG